jgi:hypothetical protein
MQISRKIFPFRIIQGKLRSYSFHYYNCWTDQFYFLLKSDEGETSSGSSENEVEKDSKSDYECDYCQPLKVPPCSPVLPMKTPKNMKKVIKVEDLNCTVINVADCYLKGALGSIPWYCMDFS